MSGGVYTYIDVPGANQTLAYGINDAGQIVGVSWNGPHGFLLSGGVYTSIDVPGAVETYAAGINDAGQVVGRYFEGGGSVPLPPTVLLLGSGLLGLVGWRRFRKG